MLNENKSLFSGKIAIATNDLKRITGHIGRCRAFVVYKIKNGEIQNREVRNNLFTQLWKGEIHHQHHGEGKEHSHLRLIEGLKDCQYLISTGGGWRVVEDLKEYNITTLFADVELIDDAIDKFIKGKLKNDERLICNHDE